MNRGFAENKRGALRYLTVPSFEATGRVRHAFSTRHGGVSGGHCATLNLSFGRGDEPENVRRNYGILCGAIGVDPMKLVFSKQIHNDNVYHVTKKDIGMGLARPSELTDADALICDIPGIPLVTFYADCVPILLLDPVRGVTALVHSGWRGTVKRILTKALTAMRDEYGCRRDDILAAIGPSIGPCCYEVDGDVAGRIDEALGDIAEGLTFAAAGGKFMADLWGANLVQLCAFGVPDENITLAETCTMCHSDDFFSHRATGGRRGGMAAIIELVGEGEP